MIIVLLIAALLMPQAVHAAYLNQATVLRHEQDQNGAARLWMRFQGNAGEPLVDRPYPVSGTSTLAGLRDWINGVVQELNLARTAGTAPQVAPGTAINGLAASPPAQSAKSLWRGKVQIYNLSCTNGFIDAVATACSTLKADIEGTYQAGFLDAN
jgi:hypothetical protein